MVPSKPEPVLVVSYEPFKCGICDISTHNMQDILSHCKSSHELSDQYKCAFCTFTSDLKSDVELHYTKLHPHYLPTVLKLYFVDPSTCTQVG